MEMGPRFSLIRKTGEAWNWTHDPRITRRVAKPLHNGGFFLWLYSPVCVTPGWEHRTGFLVMRLNYATETLNFEYWFLLTFNDIQKEFQHQYHTHLETKNWLYGCIIWASSWENRLFAYAKTKSQISFTVTAKLISAFVFTTKIVQSLFFLNPKFQASSYLLWLHSLVFVGPGRKPECWFPHNEAHFILILLASVLVNVLSLSLDFLPKFPSIWHAWATDVDRLYCLYRISPNSVFTFCISRCYIMYHINFILS